MTATTIRNKHVGATGNGGQFATRNRSEGGTSLAGGASEYIALDSDVLDEDVTEQNIDFEVKWRLGERELKDSTAVAIARGFATPERPALSELALTGYARRDDVYQELSDLNQDRDAIPYSKRNRLDMMFTWCIHSGDND